MPQRRKSQLAKKTAGSRKKIVTRGTETLNRRERRLEAQRLRQESLREMEAIQQAITRKKTQRIRQAELREIETLERRNQRKEAQRRRQRILREIETVEENNVRRETQRERQRALRRTETVVRRRLRRKEQRERQETSRKHETAEEAKLRREDQRERQTAVRENETAEEQRIRRQEQRERQAAVRENETAEEGLLRREEQRDRQAAVRENETAEEGRLRREEQRDRQAAVRENETAEEGRLRREEQRDRQAAVRENETAEEGRLRREEQRDRQAAVRENETAEEGRLRREEQRERQQDLIRTESSQRRRDRLNHESRRQLGYRKTQWQVFENKAFHYSPVENYDSHNVLNIGRMENVCVHCCALKWVGEASGMCCCNGKVRLPPLQNPPQPLLSLMSGTTNRSKQFLKNIRKYNSCFQMTSFGATNQFFGQGFMPTFKVQGQVYHKIGSLLPLDNEQPQFLQIYFTGNAQQEIQHRCNIASGTVREVVKQLQEMFHKYNSYVKIFKSALQRMPSDDYRIVIRADKKPAGQHERRFNEPLTDEVAIVIVGNEFDKRDIVLQKQNNELQRVAETHRSYDALQYPIIFWAGEDGYHFSLPQVNPITNLPINNKKVTAMNFYAYRIMMREGNFNLILKSRQLLHQFVVDMYAKIETERLLYIRYNQKKLRVDEYIHLRDSLANDDNSNNLGQLVILPSSFVGSPRHMQEYTQDAMTYVRNYGRPDLFITFTCNPKWEEIQRELLPGQTHYDRHDLTARIFKQKLIKFLDIIVKGRIFGETRCWMYTVEWQKRGLPHAHFLIWLKHKIRPNQTDDIISAEIPNPLLDPLLHSIVLAQMIHGPCGNINRNSPCMKEGKCTKNYPRKFLDQTQTDKDGYPLYRRRNREDGGEIAKMKIIGPSSRKIDFDVDNRWVVPFCPLLSKIFKAHINVESCNSVKAIKYLCKYINKGSDMAVFELEGGGTSSDEVQNYQMGRYISSNEAVWRILNFPIHERYPTVVHLAVHLENGQRVYFTEENLQNRIQNPPNTTLTAFFLLCQQDDFAKTLLYCNVPQYYTWNSSRKVFKRRVQGVEVPGWSGIKSTDALGRVYTVHPNNFECFYLRILLHWVKGPTSFQALRSFNGHIYETYREACQIRGLLEDDGHWNTTMLEAAATKSPSKLRDLFVLLVTTCGVSNPKQLWELHKESMTEDILFDARRQNPYVDIAFTPQMFNKTLIILESKVLGMIGKTLQQIGLPPPRKNQSNRLRSEMLRELSYDVGELNNFVQQNEPRLTPEQSEVYQTLLNQITNKTGGIYFLDAPGGTGKTFLINLLLSRIRQQSKIAIAMASSGIASTLLLGGRTVHSTLKLPLNLNLLENPLCNIKKGTGVAQVLKECELIVWDECTMSHKHALEALNTTMQDLRGNHKIIGGVVLLLAGDFRQTLPVVPKGTMADELNASMKASHLWKHVTKLKLQTNMRVYLQNDSNAERFARELIAIGEGRVPVDPTNGLIRISNLSCKNVESCDLLKSSVFPNIENHYKDMTWLCERAILAPKNDSVNVINFEIQEQLPGASTLYNSIDTVVDINQAVHYPTEFLNSLEISGMPPHRLILKIGSPIMLLRNLDPPKLCNGTRLCVKRCMPHIIEATILSGCAKGEDVFLPRIPLISSDATLPFEFKRLQFPIRLAFAMSINKSQGQTLKYTGIHLESPCFSHGQLYVACSRVGTGKNLFIYAPDSKTKNIVYQAAL